MSDLMNFTYRQTPVRVMIKDDGIYFFYRDLCRISGFRTAAEKNAAAPVYEQISTPFTVTTVRLISRCSVFAAIANMNDGHALRAWLTEDVLPEIYKRPDCEQFKSRPPWEIRRQANPPEAEKATAKETSGEHARGRNEVRSFLQTYFALMRMLMSVPVEQQPVVCLGFGDGVPLVLKRGSQHDR